MPLPLKVLRVYPNPWAFIHHELGPQGAFPVDPAGRLPKVIQHVGAELYTVKPADRENVRVGSFTVADPRGDGTKARFRFPTLELGFLKGKPVEIPVTGYYLQALEEGSLVPADEKTAKAAKCRFKDLDEAKKAGIEKFDADLGEGTWTELEALIAEQAKEAPKPDAASTGRTGKRGKRGGDNADSGNADGGNV